MPDIAAGHRLTTLDFLPTVEDTQGDDITGITSTSFTTTGGNICGVPFTAPYSGRVVISHQARLGNGTATAATEVTPVVRTGAVVGSGSSIVAANSANAVRWLGSTNDQASRFGSSLLVEGLTPGDSYNVQLEHRVSGGTGRVTHRHVIIRPAN